MGAGKGTDGRRAGRALAWALPPLVLVVMVSWVLWQNCGLAGCPDVELLRGYVPEEASVVVDREGRELAKLYRVRRTVVPLDSLPPYVPAAVVAVEDRRFWEHGGVDWQRVVGAALVNLRAGRFQQGFSTITMQLARNLFPDRLPAHERTISRKLAEMRVAFEIEAKYDKKEILELYLNQIYFGNGAWGIDAAAGEYFGKRASELTLAEAALLAGIVRAPSRLNPRVNPDYAVGMRNVVLRRMVEQGLVSVVEAEAASREELKLARDRVDVVEPAAYFVEQVRRQVEARLGEAVYTGGLRIRTTLDLRVQEVAEEELSRQLRAIESGELGRYTRPVYAGPREDEEPGPYSPYLQGAVVVLDARRGDVLAWVGGRDFRDSKFDRVVQAKRQTGSAFKPFVYAAALAAGYPPTTILDDVPMRMELAGGQVWAPQNFGGSYAGRITMRQALVQSRNVATVRLAQRVGLEAVLDLAGRLGLNGLPAVPSVVIGSGAVTLLDLTAAYAAFGRGGRRPVPRLILSVKDRRGRELWPRAPEPKRVLDPGVAFVVTDLMRDVVDRGTATSIRRVGYWGPAAGKTGTTNDATDVWFVGVTPELAAGVWVGFDRPRTVVPGATGGEVAAPIWGRIMRRIAPADAPGWSRPPGVEVREVDEWGNVVAPGCYVVGPTRPEYFLAGTAPPARCGGGYARGWGGRSPGDTVDLPGTPQEEAFHRRVWRRFFGAEPNTGEAGAGRGRAPAAPTDSGGLLGRPVDTVRARPSEREPRGERRREEAEERPPDTVRERGGGARRPAEPARPDTVRPPASPPAGEGAERPARRDRPRRLLGRPVPDRAPPGAPVVPPP